MGGQHGGEDGVHRGERFVVGLRPRIAGLDRATEPGAEGVRGERLAGEGAQVGGHGALPATSAVLRRSIATASSSATYSRSPWSRIQQPTAAMATSRVSPSARCAR